MLKELIYQEALARKTKFILKYNILAAFLWRKYTRTPNCDTSVLDQQQVHTKKFQPFLDYSIVHHVLTL